MVIVIHGRNNYVILTFKPLQMYNNERETSRRLNFKSKARNSYRGIH